MMSKTRRRSDLIWRLMRPLNRHVVPKAAKTKRMSSLVLLLTTTGRKSGLPRTTPLQYETLGGIYYLGSARGQGADWYMNILSNHKVQIQIGEKKWDAIAEAVSDNQRIADFLELRMKHRPLMIRAMLFTHGVMGKIDRSKLEKLAHELALVVVTPDYSEGK